MIQFSFLQIHCWIVIATLFFKNTRYGESFFLNIFLYALFVKAFHVVFKKKVLVFFELVPFLSNQIVFSQLSLRSFTIDFIEVKSVEKTTGPA